MPQNYWQAIGKRSSQCAAARRNLVPATHACSWHWPSDNAATPVQAKKAGLDTQNTASDTGKGDAQLITDEVGAEQCIACCIWAFHCPAPPACT